ncbi:MAG: hypothetical protein H6538_01160 [Bacteroidales bacterium]|nr:hypothetical protein [Bacteroidales bacterium]MCB8999840.1 hypothetical protein [Bacteroidales bacterium]MCB9012651.1 hypothetical protein [Bacteroidales bacterium]
MLYKILSGDRFLTVLIIFLLALGLWMPAFLSSGVNAAGSIDSSMPLYNLLKSVFGGNILFSRIFTLFLVILEAFLLVRINAKFVLVQQRTFLPALFFILISGHSPALLQWNPVLPAVVFIILVMESVFRSYSDEPHSYRFLNAGMLLGAGSLFYAPLIYMLVFIWLSNMVQRPFYWREYLYPLIGMLIPYIFISAYLFLGNQSLTDYFSGIRPEFALNFSFHNYNWVYWVFLFYLAILVLMSSVFLIKVFQFRKIYIRNYFMVLFWFFISGLGVFALFSGFNIIMSYLLAVPVSFMLTNYFINARKTLGNKILLYLLILYTLFLSVNSAFEIFV